MVRADQQRKMVPASVSENAEAGDEGESSLPTTFACEAQVFFAKGDAARDHVVDKFVEQGVVIHRLHLLR